MTEFKRKKGESFEGFLRKFNKSLIKSRKLPEEKGRKYHADKINKVKQKKKALKGLKIQEKNEYLKKIGKLKEEVRNRW